MITEAAPGERGALVEILAQSFEGWYLRHSRKTLLEVERVRVAQVAGRAVGLSMLKRIDSENGYVYYVAVGTEHRRQGIGGKLVDDAVAWFWRGGATVVYASVENEAAEGLFASRGFERTDFFRVVKEHGMLRAVSMYRSMLSVPGETLLRVRLGPRPASHA